MERVRELLRSIPIAGDWDRTKAVFPNEAVIDKFVELLQQHGDEQRNEALEEVKKAMKKAKFNGDYKDCPAAWVNCCFDKFMLTLKSIRRTP